MSGKIRINISKKMANKVKECVDKSEGEFKSVEEYIEFVLAEVLKEDEDLTFEEEEEIKEKLRKLGYLG